MKYPAINLSLEALKAREGNNIQEMDLADFQFHINTYHPGSGGNGSFHGQKRVIAFQDLNELADILINQSDLAAEAFYYPDAMATCGKIEAELVEEGITCTWKDQMSVSEFTGAHPARARVCYYRSPKEDVIEAVAVLRDGTTIANFRPLQGQQGHK